MQSDMSDDASAGRRMSPEAGRCSARVLFVDDEIAIAEAVSELLNAEGYEVLTASSGQGALEVLRSTPVDVIILDYMMPLMDGRETAGAIRADARLGAVPIILVTAVREPPRAPGLWDVVLPKPFDSARLVKVIEDALGRARG